MMLGLRRKSPQARALKYGLDLGRAIKRMSDSANALDVGEARPSTEAMVRAAVRLARVFPHGSAQRRELDTLIAAGRELLVALDVGCDRPTAAAPPLVDSFNRLMPLLWGES